MGKLSTSTDDVHVILCKPPDQNGTCDDSILAVLVSNNGLLS